ncbi:MAG TPA: DUF4331 family protein, partial [Chitinophagaceae bacterium]|nr:DUF4331 family protein [Chitinophagaceae bacterium]
SLGAFGFGNGQDGLFALKGSAALAGTALDDAVFGNLLLPAANSPRSVDLWPIFNTGVPNLRPYQLATGKGGNPLAAGKPFVNNFLPNGGDMLRLNMAVPVTQRNDTRFSSEGLIQAAVLGLTAPAYNSTTSLQFIPNMDGFPNGRRLEDDVTLIELQAVSGIALAAIGLWYDDFHGTNPVTPDLLNVLAYRTGVNANDAPFKSAFPYVASPWSGTHVCDCNATLAITTSRISNEQSQPKGFNSLGLASPEINLKARPNPSIGITSIDYSVDAASQVRLIAYDMQGKMVKILVDQKQEAGVHSADFDLSNLPRGTYLVAAIKNGAVKQTIKVVKN